MTSNFKTIEIKGIKYLVLKRFPMTKNTDVEHIKSLYKTDDRQNILTLKKGNEIFIVEEILDAEWEELDE